MPGLIPRAAVDTAPHGSTLVLYTYFGQVLQAFTAQADMRIVAVATFADPDGLYGEEGFEQATIGMAAARDGVSGPAYLDGGAAVVTYTPTPGSWNVVQLPSPVDLVAGTSYSIIARDLSSVVGSAVEIIGPITVGGMYYPPAPWASSTGSSKLHFQLLTETLFTPAAGVSGSSLSFSGTIVFALEPAAGVGGSYRLAPLVRLLHLDPAAGTSGGALLGTVDGVVLAGFQPAAGRSGSSLAPRDSLLALQLADAAGRSGSSLTFGGQLALALQPAAGVGGSVWGDRPDLSDNPPIELVLTLSGQYLCYQPPA